MTGSLADAEDLAQETFLRAYEQIGSFRGNARFSTWLYRIAINTCLNWRQSEARRYALYARAATELAAQTDGREGHSAAPVDEIQAALMKLPAKQRAAMVLTICEGLSHAEAAHALGCSETTVSWRVFTAKRKLKRLLVSRPDASALTRQQKAPPAGEGPAKQP
jgi:RNA polymerase sigma-70 factor (ECF subfamily)